MRAHGNEQELFHLPKLLRVLPIHTQCVSAIRKPLTFRLSDIAAAVLLCKLHCSEGLLDCLETHRQVQGFLYSQNAPSGRLS